MSDSRPDVVEADDGTTRIDGGEHTAEGHTDIHQPQPGEVAVSTAGYRYDDEPNHVELRLSGPGATTHLSLTPAQAAHLADDLATLAAELDE